MFLILNKSSKVIACFLSILLCSLQLNTIQAEEMYKIGVIAPLSGDIANFGTSIRQGLELANLDSEKSSTKIKLIFEDEQTCSANLALAAFHKLVNLDRAKIVYVGCLNGTKAILPIAKKSNVLLISLGFLDEYTYESNTKIVNFAGSIRDESQFIVDELNKQHYKNISLLRVEDNFTDEFYKHFLGHIKFNKLNLVDDVRLQFSDFDLKSHLLKLAQKNPEVLVTYLTSAQLVSLMKQMRTYRLSFPVWGGYAVEGGIAPDARLSELNSIIYSYPSLKINQPEIDQFNFKLENYNKENFKPAINAVYAFDSLNVVKQALNSCIKDDIDCLFKEIINHANSSKLLASGLKIDPQGKSKRLFALKQIKDGKFDWYE